MTKFKVGKPYKTGMQREGNWSKAIKKVYNKMKSEFTKKNPNLMEAKRKKQSKRKRELSADFQKKTKELDRQLAMSNEDKE